MGELGPLAKKKKKRGTDRTGVRLDDVVVGGKGVNVSGEKKGVDVYCWLLRLDEFDFRFTGLTLGQRRFTESVKGFEISVHWIGSRPVVWELGAKDWAPW